MPTHLQDTAMGYYRVQHNWRDQYNPLRGPTIQRIITMENAAERGDYSDLQWFWVTCTRRT